MRNRELARQLDSLKSLLDRTDMATGGDIELAGHWGRYLCVMTAGFLENALRETYGEFAKRTAGPQVAKFAMSKLDGISNPKAGRFIETAKSFSSEWADGLKLFLDENDGRRRNAIDSIMNNRHLIAHGKGTQISISRLRDYLPHCIDVVEFIESQLH